MSWFVFRNMTVERLFDNLQPQYSGYEDISAVPAARSYIWAYLAPYTPDTEAAAAQIASYEQMLQLVLQRIASGANIVALTITDLFSVSATLNNHITKAIDAYNTKLYALADEHRALKVVDSRKFFARYANEQWVDWKYYFISQMAVNPRLSGDFQQWFASQIEAIEFRRKKCLVLDLDNTLWGGILGEDGVTGIQLGQDYPGSAFLMFQKQLLELAKSGVILTVCSKNNIDDVRNVWQKHPDLLIKEQQLAAFQINWNNKADNIKQLAKMLNIGTDSMVFIDDNPTERELVKGMLPEIEVPEFPAQPYLLPAFMEQVAKKHFTTYCLTAEDTKKTEQYKANAQREEGKALFDNFDHYIKSLDIKLKIEPVNEFTTERAAQMTQKTNQFNLTTPRYTTSDIETLQSQGARAFTLSVADKFGDNGITALIIFTLKNKVASIDTLLMSCRVLGKNIEKEFVNFVINTIFNTTQVEVVRGQYIKTAKNGQTENFYDSLGFENLGQGDFLLEKNRFKYNRSNLYNISI